MNSVLKNIKTPGWFRLMALFVLVLLVEKAHAQQDAQYTQYMYNTMSVNPAYAGSRGHMSIAGLYRAQWLGLEGAPTTQTFNVHSPIGYRGVGLGLSVINDKIGPTSETSLDADFSYTIWTSKEGRISFGLKASANLLDIRFSELDDYGTNPNPQQNIDNRFSPNIGAGVYYHTKEFYVGLSVPRFLETTHFDSSSLSSATEQMNFYLMTGYVWELNQQLKFKPAILVKMVKGAPLQIDLSANFMFVDKFIIGAAYRWDAALSGLVGFNISNNMFLGIAYDKEITALGDAAFNDGSFEFILRYDFIFTKNDLRSPRFF